MDRKDRIYVAGHRGMVGSAIVRELEKQGFENILKATHAELDLTRQAETEAFFEKERPDYVFLAAARVGGIGANSTYPADFMYENMMISMNVLNAAYRSGVKRVLFLGSSCIYPREAPQPIPESALLSSALEQTNEAYALAKISGLKYCSYLNRQYGTDYISVMPCNLYGPGDDYDPDRSHVLPAMIHRFHEAKEAGLKEVVCWGDGSPLREFLYVEDLAELCVLMMEAYHGDETVNAGTGKEISIRELSLMVADIVGYSGEIRWDTSKPNGTPRKVLDVSRALSLGWRASTALKDGIALAYEDYMKRIGKG